MLVRAKGDKRTMKQFAQECGVSPSTMSRIVHQGIRGTSSDRLIKTIAEHADPESGVTIDALMAAHGMVLVRDERTAFKISPSKIEKKFASEILYQLEEADDLIDYTYDEKIRFGLTFCYCPDLLIRSKSVKKGNNRWAFELLCKPVYDGQREDRDFDQSIRWYAKHIYDLMGRVSHLLLDNVNNKQALGKISFVVADGRVFDYLLAEFANYYVTYDVSFMLFNYEKERIEDEFILNKI